MASAMSSTHTLKEMEPFLVKVTKFTVALSTLGFVPFIVLGDKFLSLWINPEIALQAKPFCYSCCWLFISTPV